MSLVLLFNAGSGPDEITPDEAVHGHTADAATVTTTTEITPSDSLHGHTVDAPIVVTVFIVPDETLHGHTADAATIIQVISPADSTHAQLADATTVSSPTVITPADTLHGHTADQAAILGNAIPGAIEVELISPTMYTEMILHDTTNELVYATTTTEVFD